MYQYVYDGFLSDKGFAKELSEIENRLTDLGIHGRIDRIHPFRSLREALDDGIRQGVRTVVAVGNDETFKKVLDIVAGKGLTMGFVPMIPGTAFGALLGIPAGVAACDALSARLSETLDIGRVNGQYFLAAVSFFGQDVTLECEGRYRVELVHGGRVSICNVAMLDGGSPTGNPFDGYLDAVLEPAAQRGLFRRASLAQSVLPLKRVIARAEKPFKLFADGRELEQERAEITVAEERIRLIIGKGRAFAGAPAA